MEDVNKDTNKDVSLEGLVDFKLESRNDKLSETEKSIIKTVMINTVENEVKAKYKQEVIAEATKKAQEDILFAQIEEANKMLKIAMLVAFIIGILVNQASEIITYVVGKDDVMSNVGRLVIILICLSVAYFVYNGTVSDMMKKYYMEKRKRQNDK